MLRTTTTLALAALLVGCGAGERTATADSTAAATDSPASAGQESAWNARTDEGATGLSVVEFERTDGALRIRPGPRAIYWREGDSVSPPFTASATFEMVAAPERPEAYGLFVGGRDLAGTGQDYLYFLVRHDGRYLLKHRAGADTHTLVQWTEHDAVASQSEAGGPPTNALTVRATADRLVFSANGQAVDSLPSSRSMVRAAGIAGLRVNHGLDLRVTDFRVESGGAGGGG